MGLINAILDERRAQTAEQMKEMIMTEGTHIFETGVNSWGKFHTKSPLEEDVNLQELFNSDDEEKNKRAALTCIVINNQKKFMEGLINVYGEATVMGSLGALTPKILDVVRIFYPNQVAHLLTDIQPLTQQTGQIFILKPKYTQTAAGVTAGQEVFKNMTDGNYASEKYTQSIGTGNGSSTSFIGSLQAPVKKDGTVIIKRAGNKVASDNGSGLISGTDGGTVSGTVDYTTGQLIVTYAVAPASGAMTVEYLADSEINTSLIRQLELALDMVPVRAQEHPLTVKWSITAQMAAQAHLGLDIGDMLTDLASQFVRVERDQLIISLIGNSATVDSNLDFSAAANANIPKWQTFQEIELKMNAGESGIQAANGNRGGVSWLIAGYNASNVWRQVRGFVDEAPKNPIGAHKLGTLRNGQVDVIKAPFLNTNKYVIGFKGYMPGDSATILAEWIPMYFTPIFQSPVLQGERGVMSLYDIFVNNAAYYRIGTISNYTA